jgi:hypothetical protein
MTAAMMTTAIIAFLLMPGAVGAAGAPGAAGALPTFAPLIFAPHFPQKVASVCIFAPHFGQKTISILQIKKTKTG